MLDIEKNIKKINNICNLLILLVLKYFNLDIFNKVNEKI